jgi:hypothetical protein
MRTSDLVHTSLKKRKINATNTIRDKKINGKNKNDGTN